MVEKNNIRRPRTSTPDKNDTIKLGEDLVQWATENTKEWRCLLSQWWCLKQKMPRAQWKAMKLLPEFLPYYEIAQQAMAVKCVKGVMKDGFGQRYIRLYDPELKEEEDNKKRFEAELKKMSPEEAQDLLIKIVNYSEHGKDIDKPLKKEARKCKKK